MISRPVAESRLPVGSSANTIDGSLTSARAMATRCRCPPDISVGRWRARSASPTRCRASMARLRRSRRPKPAYTIGSSTLRNAVMRGSRLNVWKIKPTRSLRMRARSWSDIVDTSEPASS